MENVEILERLVDDMSDHSTNFGTVVTVVLIPVILSLVFKVYTKLTMGRCRSQNRLEGKTVIITGSNTGIGKETAKVLAGRGGRIIMACRNMEKAEEAAKEIRAENAECSIVVMHLDLCSLASVRRFARKILEKEHRIDILLNNAGISGGKFRLTEDGFEEVYQANYLGPFYLTELLKPLLKKSAPARILNVGSVACLYGSVNATTFVDDMRIEKTSSFFRYGNSKLAMLMWTRALAQELRSAGVCVNYIHPGVVATTIATGNMNISNFLFRTNISIHGRTVEEGAQTLIHLCLDPDGSKKTGKFWSECRPTWMPKGKDVAQNTKLLEVTRECLGLQE